MGSVVLSYEVKVIAKSWRSASKLEIEVSVSICKVAWTLLHSMEIPQKTGSYFEIKWGKMSYCFVLGAGR